MGILDELKEQAEAEKARLANDSKAVLKRKSDTEAALLPKMRALYEYFTEFQNYVGVVKPEVDVNLKLLKVGVVTGLGQEDYQLSTNDREKITSFRFRYICTKKGVVQVAVEDAAQAGIFKDYIRDNQLRAKVRPNDKGGSVFIVDLTIPANISFHIDVEHAKLILRMRNFGTMGVTQHSLTTEQVSDTFLDELAKAILHKPNRLDQLLGNALTDTGMLKIKKRVKAAIRQNDIEEQLSKKVQKESITKKFSRTFLGRKAG